MVNFGFLGGRPPIYETPDEMAKAMVTVFENPDFDFTITGLALELGFCSRQSLFDYESKEGFSYIVKKAKAIVERAYEAKLSGQSVTGAIFALKNMGWKDKSEIDMTARAVTLNELPPNPENELIP